MTTRSVTCFLFLFVFVLHFSFWTTTAAAPQISIVPTDLALTCPDSDAGKLKCSGRDKFYICDPARPPILQAVAAGTVCDSDQIITAGSGGKMSPPQGAE